MKTIASTEAKSNFGALIDAAQREPVTIEKKGRPVAVMISHLEYRAYEQMKLESLQRDLRVGIEQADKGELIDGEEAFRDLI
ncbi:hypothetical protein MTYM_01448 [Methylococcales bacterium]|nr:hypothetical protein MTYM_01448 [Methylococcales bacterium]